MADVRLLPAHQGPIAGSSMFCPALPAGFRASSPTGGVGWLCARCRTPIVEGARHEDQFLDLLFRCPSCGQVLATRTRRPGRPLAGRPLYLPPGSYRTETVVWLDHPVMFVGPDAIAGYDSEVGTWGGPGLDSFSSAELRSAATFAASLPGDNYPTLEAADRRGRESHTPPVDRTRLVELVEYGMDGAVQLDLGIAPRVVVSDGSALAELATLVALFRRWSRHPELQKLIQTVGHPTEFHHSLMVLAVASYLVDAGNGTGIIGDAGASGRIPDLWTEPSLIERMEVEVKTPQELRGPLGNASLTESSASRLVERLIDRAASTQKGQLDPEFTGIVAIGCFHLGPGGADLLEVAIQGVLKRQAHRKRHLAGVIVCELRADQQPVQDGATEAGQTAFAPVLDVRLVPHAGYQGELTLDTSQPRFRTAPAGGPVVMPE